MVMYSIILFLTAALFTVLGIAIYKGKTDLIHDYHQTKVQINQPTEKPLEKQCLLSQL